VTKHLIIIPAYNEAASLPGVVRCLAALPPCYEWLVINDGSTDETGAVAESLAEELARPMHVVHLSANSGIGAAVQTGYLFAKLRGDYQYVIQFDGDGQHDAASIEALVNTCETNNLDLCIGSRFLQPIEGQFRSTALRRVGITYLSALIASLTGARITDSTSGFRCLGPRAWRHFAERYPDDFPEPETVFWCLRNQLKVQETPVRMHARQGGESSIRSWRTAYYMLKVTLAIFADRLRRQEAPQ